MKHCPVCGADCIGFKFCSHCGADLSAPAAGKGASSAKPAAPAGFESFLNADGVTYTVMGLKDKTAREIRIPSFK